MNEQTLIISALALGLLSLALSTYSLIAARKTKQWRQMVEDEGQQPQNLEDIIAAMTAKIRALESKEELLRADLESLQALSSKAVQKVGLIRFNSQADDGGNLSFSLALLDDHQTGTVITSLHGRQQNRIYAKRIIEGKSEATLSSEETDAIIQAVQL